MLIKKYKNFKSTKIFYYNYIIIFFKKMKTNTLNKIIFIYLIKLLFKFIYFQ